MLTTRIECAARDLVGDGARVRQHLGDRREGNDSGPDPVGAGLDDNPLGRDRRRPAAIVDAPDREGGDVTVHHVVQPPIQEAVEVLRQAVHTPPTRPAGPPS